MQGIPGPSGNRYMPFGATQSTPVYKVPTASSCKCKTLGPCKCKGAAHISRKGSTGSENPYATISSRSDSMRSSKPRPGSIHQSGTVEYVSGPPGTPGPTVRTKGDPNAVYATVLQRGIPV